MTMSRKTQQRKWIRHVFEHSERPLTPQEVLESAQQYIPGLGIATVYRNLKAFNEEGLLSAVELPGEPTRYEISGLDPHHFFQCEDCGKVYDIPADDEDIQDGVPEQFQVKSQRVLLYGLCPECAVVLV